MAVKCPRCQADNPDTSRFCGNCATQLTPAGHAPVRLTKTLESPATMLTAGSLIAGKYRILEEVGRGGMGVVYKAEDTTLARKVAVKVLPETFTADPERLARFEREARLLASLNHPNIAAIHGVEEADGRRFLVLEFVEGETLAGRLSRGPLSLEETLDVCRQIAEGLKGAHEKGIIHRDLKPSNIKITPEGEVKILDFGLAKAFHDQISEIDIGKSPTITADMTQPGVILGTAAYMSPEQTKGRSLDKRVDIWAYGCILFECLTGKVAFPGETVTESIAAILKVEPDWGSLPAGTPGHIRAVLRRCLQKDRNLRYHDIADAWIEIEAPAAYPSETVPARRPFLRPWLAGGAAAVVFLSGILVDRLFIRHPRAAAPGITATIKVEPGHWLSGWRLAEEKWPTRTAMAISSDGRFLIYAATEENPAPPAQPQLYLRRMDQAEAKPIAGTEGGVGPFLSPDNRWVGFWADGKLKKVPVDGGVAATLCESAWYFGASWGPGNIIVFVSGSSSGLSKVSADGGTVESLTSLDPKREADSYGLPSWLPNGKGVLFTLMKYPWDMQPRLAVLDLNTREWVILLPDAADARYVPTGHLVFMRQGMLMAVRFDAAKLQIIGQPAPVVENVIQALVPWGGLNTGAGQFSVSNSGSLVYAAGGVLPDMQNSLVWVDQKGSEQPAAPLLFPFQAPRLSPDGRRVTYVTRAREWQVYVYDLNTGTNSRLTHEGMSPRAIWTPDGRRIVFPLYEPQGTNLFWQPYDGSSPKERLRTSEFYPVPGSWSPDGKTLAIVETHPDTGADICALDAGSGRVTPFQNSPFNESFPEFSPDGRWLAYVSDESGRDEVYARPFPGPGMKHQVSNQGGIQPLWARDGRQIFYRWEDQVWAVDVQADGGFSTGRPRLLFELPGYGPGAPTRSYDLSQDGRRFLMVKVEQRKPRPVTEMILVQNWFEELKRLVPGGKS